MSLMAEREPFEQLEDAVEAILAGAGPVPEPEDAEIASLLQVALSLRGLPAEPFRGRLKEELMESAANVPSYLPPGAHSVTPYLSLRSASRLVDFVKEAFGATEIMRTTGSAGGMHAEV